MIDESGSFEQFHRLASLTQKEAATEIRGMIGQVETVQLDFVVKRNSAEAALHPDDKRNFAKAVSGFSNSDGGLLIWGVEARSKGHDHEVPDVAVSIQPISHVDAFCTLLNQQVVNATTPVVSNVQNKAIIENQKTREGFCLTFVPSGDNPPYRADLEGLHEYYKRAASNFYRMEPYDIRDVIFRFKYPKLEIDIERGPDIHDVPNIRSINVRLTNRGPVSLRGFKFILMIPQALIVATNKFPPNVTKQFNGISYSAYTFKAFVGFTPIQHREWRREPVYPSESIMLFTDIRYRIDLHDGLENLLTENIYWQLFGDDLPGLDGKKPLVDFML